MVYLYKTHRHSLHFLFSVPLHTQTHIFFFYSLSLSCCIIFSPFFFSPSFSLQFNRNTLFGSHLYVAKLYLSTRHYQYNCIHITCLYHCMCLYVSQNYVSFHSIFSFSHFFLSHTHTHTVITSESGCARKKCFLSFFSLTHT